MMNLVVVSYWEFCIDSENTTSFSKLLHYFPFNKQEFIYRLLCFRNTKIIDDIFFFNWELVMKLLMFRVCCIKIRKHFSIEVVTQNVIS